MKHFMILAGLMAVLCFVQSVHANAPNIYGAVAYDAGSGAYGISDAMPDENSARQSAMKYCATQGKNCKVVDTFIDTCVAVAHDTGGTMAGWDHDEDPEYAAEDALDACEEKAPKGVKCVVGAEVCYRG